MLFSPGVFTVLCLLSVVQTEIVPDFEVPAHGCLQFFYNYVVPELGVENDHIEYICQRYKNSDHFATLYDTQRRIPVYSAYVFQPGNGNNRPTRWFIEPQLVNISWSPDMMYESQCPDKNQTLLGENQALDGDYHNRNHTIRPGHLNPYLHNIGDGAIATFTLTNAVPQVGSVNSGVWRVYEGKLHALLRNCSTAYVVVGAIPSANTWISNNRVNVPDYLWNAWCCVDSDGIPVQSGAAKVQNEKDEEDEVEELSLDQLATFLTPHMQSVGNIFHNNCKSE